MNRLVAATPTLVVCFWSLGCFAQSQCEQKEYAEYKDQALTASGRLSMASDYCLFANRLEAGQKTADLAIKYRMARDADVAMRVVDSCIAAQSKIKNALTAAKATNAIHYMVNGCKGSYIGTEGKK